MFARHKAKIRSVHGVYGENFAALDEIAADVNSFAKEAGRRPRLLVAKLGQDGHDRGAKVVATAFGDLGFDVEIGALFRDPKEVVDDALAAKVGCHRHLQPGGGHLTLVPQVMEALKARGRDDILVLVGGVIPAQDYEALRAAGVAAIFGPGTNIPDAARSVLGLIRARRRRNIRLSQGFDGCRGCLAFFFWVAVPIITALILKNTAPFLPVLTSVTLILSIGPLSVVSNSRPVPLTPATARIAPSSCRATIRNAVSGFSPSPLMMMESNKPCAMDLFAFLPGLVARLFQAIGCQRMGVGDDEIQRDGGLEFFQRGFAVLRQIGGLTVPHQGVGLFAIRVIFREAWHRLGAWRCSRCRDRLPWPPSPARHNRRPGPPPPRSGSSIRSVRENAAAFFIDAQFAFGIWPSIFSEFATTDTMP